MINRTTEAALAFARRGVPVFPCQPGGKAPLTPHGYLDATTDLDQIREWFERQPELNLAVATGAPGPDVLDVDERGAAGNGFPALARLEAAGLLAGAVARIRTPSGGVHLYFAGSGQRSGHLAAHHVDFLANGGYVLIPPSNVGGRPYQLIAFLRGRGQLDWPAAARLLQPSRAAGRSSFRPASAQQAAQLSDWVARQPVGNRNSSLFWAANRLLETDHAADLSPLAAAARRAGLADPEIAKTLDSARRTSQARPEPPGRQAEGEH